MITSKIVIRETPNVGIYAMAGAGKVDNNLRRRRQPTNFKNALLGHSRAMTG